MTNRNISPFTFFERAAAAHRPAHAFQGRTRAEFARWKKTLLPKVLATLGHQPKKMPPRPQLLAEWREEGLIKQRWVIDVQPNLAAIVLVYRPADLPKDERRPAILCCHGHGLFGKDSVMGIGTNDTRRTDIEEHNYDYGRQMARCGFVTFALDWMGFGERDSRNTPSYKNLFGDRDPCNIHFLCATMLGTTVLALNCHDASRATDFVCSMPFVDAERLGVMGLSYGGTMTTWMMLTDKRFVAGDIICYAGPFHEIAYRVYNVCGSQVTPGLFELCDLADLQGLIAPKPLLVEIGVHDGCFQVDAAYNDHFKGVKRIYKAAGTSDRLELDLFAGPHAWGANKSLGFFRKHFGIDP